MVRVEPCFSAIFALILSLISKKWCNFVPDALSLTALPSLFISCLVLTNIDDVRKQIKSEEESRDFLIEERTKLCPYLLRIMRIIFKEIQET